MTTEQPILGFLLHEVARLPRRSLELKSGHSGLTRSQFQTIPYMAAPLPDAHADESKLDGGCAPPDHRGRIHDDR